MSRPTALVRLALAATAATCCLLVVGCGGDDDGSGSEEGGGAAQSDRFPASVFPPDVYGDLSGTLTWYDASGGAVTRGRENSIFKNFEELTGVSSRSEVTAGSSAKFFAAMEAGQGQWDLIEFPSVGDWLSAKDKGYLEPLDTNVIPVDKLEDGTYDEFGYRTNRYATIVAWNTEKFPSSGDQPTSMTDLFDTERFPGKRCMLNYFQYGATLEAALLADGVAPEELYPLDLDRAFAKLDTIKDDIVWYPDGAQAVKLLSDGECDLGTVWNGRAYDAVTKDDAPIDIAWDLAMTQEAVYAIPKGVKNVDAAQAQLAMWLNDEPTQAEFLETVPYPIPLKEPTIPDGLEKWLPAGENLATAVPIDDAYFAENAEELNSRFTEWVGQ